MQLYLRAMGPVNHFGQGDERHLAEPAQCHLMLLVQRPVHQPGQLAFNKKTALAQAAIRLPTEEYSDSDTSEPLSRYTNGGTVCPRVKPGSASARYMACW